MNTLALAQWEDLPICMDILNSGRSFQREQGFIQWPDGFPDEESIRKDIQQSKGYVFKVDGVIAAYFYLGFDGDPAYPDIKGAWHYDAPYAVIHRIAIGRDFRGMGLADTIFRMVGDFCLQQGYSVLRIDTDAQNKRMQHVLQKTGFSYCGTVMQGNGERMAFDKWLPQQKEGGCSMKYRNDKYGNSISALGFGCMRFQRKGGNIDMEEAERELLAAIDAGVNYFDTAYIYPGSEAALGEIFSKHQLREKIYIATKLPHYLIKSRDAMDRLFDEHLKRLKTDYIDYYLMHMLTDVPTWERLKQLGILKFLEEKRASGAIRQVGFSYHGNSDMFCKLVDAYDWDFCQIQYNYMDEHTQAGRRGLQYAHSKGLPVIIMEPLRGGKLVNNLPPEALKVFEDYPISRTPAQWAFRWLWNQPEVTCVLSGMNTMEMLQDNINTASTTEIGEFGPEEEAMLAQVVTAINSKMKVGCTGCRYCMPCPKGVDIPGTFAAYNRLYSEGKFAALKEHFMCSAARKDSTAAYNCIGCGKCETHCPQHIEIRQELKNAQKQLEGPLYRTARRIVEWFKLY